jgi:hypothetical protein
MKKEDLKPYFMSHPTETELYVVGDQVYMGSQKQAAESFARTEGVAIETFKRDDVLGKKSDEKK